jgi:hypothetical protein
MKYDTDGHQKHDRRQAKRNKEEVLLCALADRHAPLELDQQAVIEMALNHWILSADEWMITMPVSGVRLSMHMMNILKPKMMILISKLTLLNYQVMRRKI